MFITYLCSKQHNRLRYDKMVRNVLVCMHHVYNVYNYIDEKM